MTSLRKLGGSKTDNKDQVRDEIKSVLMSRIDFTNLQIPQRKRGWGASKSRDDSVSISSNSLKDIVPDIAPLMDNTDPFTEREEGC